MKKITFFLFLFATTLSVAQSLEGTWKMAPQAGALGVGPGQGDTSWWSNSAGDVTTRACYFDDEYVFNANGTFTNVLGSQSWIEGWQGGGDSCGTPVAPHNGSNPATYSYNSSNNTLTLNGVGAFLGLAKVYNGGELTNPANAPASITYTVSSLTATAMTLDISIGSGWWRFNLQKQVATSPLEGTWKMSPQAGAFGVGPGLGNTSWYANSLADVTTRACFFDDQFVFNANGTFSNIQGAQTWVEGWQGSPDTCATPVAPHNGSNPATYVYNSSNNTLTLSGVGAHIGLPKVYNGGELSSPSNAPASITYIVTSISSSLMTLDIEINAGGWWRFILAKEGVPTCFDGIQNGDETGIDCGGTSCPACVTAPTVAAPTPPARPTADVVSFYSDAYTNITMNNFDAGWCGGAATTEVQIAGNNTLRKNTGVVCHGIDFTTNRQNLTDFTHLHFDFYITDADLVGDVFNVKLVNFNGTNAETSSLEVNINGGTTPQLVANQWVSVDVPITALGGVVAGSLARNDVAQIGITTANVSNVWYDNIYVHKNTVLGLNELNKSVYTIYPNPAQDYLTITANSTIEKVKIYNYLGQEMCSKEFNNDVATMDVSALNSGVYIIKTTINGTEASSKFIKR
ncbi:MAG: T9SS type A sorting domain-containing protein [Flavobacterium sp.]|nr:T9SS type A sorting domain-containing protein [Flavobacterium sp.]